MNRKQKKSLTKKIVEWSRVHQFLNPEEEIVVIGMATKMIQEVFPGKTSKKLLLSFAMGWILIYVIDYFYDTLNIRLAWSVQNHKGGFAITGDFTLTPRDRKKIQGLNQGIQSITKRFTSEQKKVFHSLIRKMLKGMDYENAISRLEKKQHFFEYIEATKETIGSKLLFSIVYYHYAEKRVAGLLDIENSCARIARMINDIVSFSKEKREKKVNGVIILMANGRTKKEAERYLREKISQEAREIKNILKYLRMPDLFKDFVLNFLTWLLKIYAK
ncbi:MAG TPA: terpene synthase family protein [Patescibacteria group bacterium]|nr:terpene synthase family protein [Patescibacteria group bacterium]